MSLIHAAIYISGSESYSSQWDLILQSYICYGIKELYVLYVYCNFAFLTFTIVIATHLASTLRGIDKQCRPRSDAA